MAKTKVVHSKRKPSLKSGESNNESMTAFYKKQWLIAFQAKAGNVTSACKASGVARMTVYRWMDNDQEFYARYLEVREELLDFAEATLLTMIKEKHPGATMFFLKTQGKHRGYAE